MRSTEARTALLVLAALLHGCGASDSVETGTPTPDSDPPPVDSDSDTDTTPQTPAWRHTVTVDGDPGDLLDAEAFPTAGGTTWITWDDDNLYVAVQHPDVASGGPQHWLLVYVGDGAEGGTSGVQFNTQEPALPVPLSHLVRWKTDGSWNSLVRFEGGVWNDTPKWLGARDGSQVAESESAQTVELAIPRGVTGLVDRAAVHVALLYEGDGYESTYAPVPGISFADGYDPDYTAWYDFDLTGSTAPADHAPLP